MVGIFLGTIRLLKPSQPGSRSKVSVLVVVFCSSAAPGSASAAASPRQKIKHPTRRLRALVAAACWIAFMIAPLLQNSRCLVDELWRSRTRRSLLQDDSVNLLGADDDLGLETGAWANRKRGAGDERAGTEHTLAVRSGLTQRLDAVDATLGVAMQALIEHRARQPHLLTDRDLAEVFLGDLQNGDRIARLLRDWIDGRDQCQRRTGLPAHQVRGENFQDQPRLAVLRRPQRGPGELLFHKLKSRQ